MTEWRGKALEKRVYLASNYGDRETMVEWADILRKEGFIVTSRWINGSHEIFADAKSDADRARFAAEDFEDVHSATFVILNSPKRLFRSGRGGKHVETGLAIAWGMPIILVGERENVFHWTSFFHVVNTFNDAVQLANRWCKRR